MIKVQSMTLNEATKEADVFLMCDSKAEINEAEPSDIIGLPEGYTLAPFSKCMTKGKDLAFLGSDNQWDWGDGSSSGSSSLS